MSMCYTFVIILLSVLTLVTEFVSAASSIAWWALGTGGAVLVWGFPDPVPPRKRHGFSMVLETTAKSAHLTEHSKHTITYSHGPQD